VLDRVPFFRARHPQVVAAGGSAAPEAGLGD
jgi:hypothetical protein